MRAEIAKSTLQHARPPCAHASTRHGCATARGRQGPRVRRRAYRRPWHGATRENAGRRHPTGPCGHRRPRQGVLPMSVWQRRRGGGLCGRRCVGTRHVIGGCGAEPCLRHFRRIKRHMAHTERLRHLGNALSCRACRTVARCFARRAALPGMARSYSYCRRLVR